MKVNILGTEYEIKFSNERNHKDLIDAMGFCDFYEKHILLEEDLQTPKNKGEYANRTLRHEIIHAFLAESGLRHRCPWHNEEAVDWLAVQFPKLAQAIVEGTKQINAQKSIDVPKPK